MNDTIKDFAKTQIIEGLKKLPERWINKFKLMYGRDSRDESVEEIYAKSIEDVVNGMPEEKLDWALQQVENSLKKTQQPEKS